jgi:hypothetical protein
MGLSRTRTEIIMDNYHKKAHENQMPKWEEWRLNPGSPNYDKEMWIARRSFLINLPESKAIFLTSKDRDDRAKYLGEIARR